MPGLEISTIAPNSVCRNGAGKPMAATSAPRIGVLAIQGAFREHVRSLCLCGAETVEIRTREDLEGLSGLVFPGGESTVMGKFLIEWGMMDRVRELIRSGMPVFGTCAGLILLCSDILDHPGSRASAS